MLRCSVAVPLGTVWSLICGAAVFDLRCCLLKDTHMDNADPCRSASNVPLLDVLGRLRYSTAFVWPAAKSPAACHVGVLGCTHCRSRGARAARLTARRFDRCLLHVCPAACRNKMTYTLYRPNGLPCYRASEACGGVSVMLLRGARHTQPTYWSYDTCGTLTDRLHAVCAVCLGWGGLLAL